jgi:hypothetical protein
VPEIIVHPDAEILLDPFEIEINAGVDHRSILDGGALLGVGHGL